MFDSLCLLSVGATQIVEVGKASLKISTQKGNVTEKIINCSEQLANIVRISLNETQRKLDSGGDVCYGSQMYISQNQASIILSILY